MLNSKTVDHILDTALTAFSGGEDQLVEVLDALPAPLYVTDKDGTIIYFNPACVEFAGRTPSVGEDKWCVTWRLYRPDGEPLPHDRCPLAVALTARRSIRNVEAVAERPDGSRVAFVPFPTPMFDEAGNLAGAVNLLLEVSKGDKDNYLRDQASRCRDLAAASTNTAIAEMLSLMAAKYDEQALRQTRLGR